MLKSINPFNQEVSQHYNEHSQNEIEKIIVEADTTFKKWRQTNFDDRTDLLRNTALILKNNIEKYSKIITMEMGKSICESRAEIEKCIRVCEYYAQNC